MARRARPAPAQPALRRLDLGRPVLRLRLPVTPSQNVWRDLHFAVKARAREAAYFVARTQVGQLSEPWAPRALVVVVRCSEATVAADSMNVWGGAKESVDALLAPRPKRPGVGLLADDSPRHFVLGGVEDRPRGHYGDLTGPATWVYLIDLSASSLTWSGDGVSDTVIRAAREFAAAELRAVELRAGMLAAVNAAGEER